MAKVVFNEVVRFGFKNGNCSVCGKNCKRKQKFYQTINPFNKNKDGSVKERNQIIFELSREIEEWEKLPIIHAKCEQAKPA